jgi:hypothetical protein
MKTSLNHFTSKIYLVTYEGRKGLGCYDYGVMSVHNKPQSANAAIKKLIKEQDKKYGSAYPKTHWEFKLQTIDINSMLPTRLFEHLY